MQDGKIKSECLTALTFSAYHASETHIYSFTEIVQEALQRLTKCIVGIVNSLFC